MDLSDPAEPWRQARIGAEPGVVPPPFEPLRRTGPTVACWGRSIEMTDLFPAAISSAGQQILAAPIAVSLRPTSGAPIVLEPGEAHFALEREDRLEWSGGGTAGPINWTSLCWIEFDGMMQIALTLRADEPTA